jgi:polysaccharide pyruvyl transferase WcaK-like protein
MESEVRVLVLWADEHSPNLGIRALARGSRELITGAWPDAEVEFADFTSRPPQVPWGRVRSLVRERVTGRLGMRPWLERFDLVWDTRSGDSLSDIYGAHRHSVMSAVHEFAVQAGRPVVMAPQTIGPFRSATGRALARRSLHRSALVFARDPVSADAAASLSRPVDAVTSDLAFAIPPPEEIARRRDVILNVSGLLWQENPHVDARAYREAVTTIVRMLLAGSRSVAVLPHVLDSHDRDNDAPAVDALAAEFGADLEVVAPRGLDDARAIIAGSRVLIGARMHACLNALSTGVPAIAMAYSRKFAPLFDAIGWPYSVSPASGGDAGAEAATRVIELLADPSLERMALETRTRGRASMAPILPALESLSLPR